MHRRIIILSMRVSELTLVYVAIERFRSILDTILLIKE